MRVLLLTSFTPANIYLVNYLTSRKKVIAKVIERRHIPESYREKMDIRKRMAKKYGILKTLNKLLYNKYRRYFIEPSHREILMKRLFPGHRDLTYTEKIPTIEVENINDRRCRDFVIAQEPDLIAVCGTTVIESDLLQLVDKGFINIHCGITPEYRSADPIFWALYNREPDKVGITIHFVDRGIDTGPIIYQEAVPVTEEDNIATLYAKCIERGAYLMAKAIDDVEKGSVQVIEKRNIRGKAYYHMDLGIWQYMMFRRRVASLLKARKVCSNAGLSER